MKKPIDYQRELLDSILELEKNEGRNIRDVHLEVQKKFSNYLSVLYEADFNQLERLRILRQTHLMLCETNSFFCTGPALRSCIRLLKIEIELHKNSWSIKHPTQETVQNIKSESVSILTWKGSINQLLELICALFHTRLILCPDGSPVSFIQLIHTFERVFKIEIKEPYRRRGTLYQRKRNQTPFLDLMKRRYNEYIKADVELSPFVKNRADCNETERLIGIRMKK